MRSGSGFWAAGHDSSHGSSAFSATQFRQLSGRSADSHNSAPVGVGAEPEAHADDSGDDSDGTEIAASSSNDGSRGVHGPGPGPVSTPPPTRGQSGQQQQQAQTQQTPVQHQQQQQQQSQQSQPTTPRAEDAGAQDAFIAGMIYALSRRLMPGAPYAPGQSGSGAAEAQRSEGGRWKLDECLR